MSNAIQFLETLGCRPANAAWNTTGYDDAVAMAGVDEQQREALLARDAQMLSRLLDGRPQIFCLVATPDGGETQDEPDKTDDEKDEPEESDDEAARAGLSG